MRSVCRARDRLNLLCTARDDEVELREDGVGQIEAAVLEDVDLDALQQRDAAQLAFSRSISRHLPREALRVEPVRHRQRAANDR